MKQYLRLLYVPSRGEEREEREWERRGRSEREEWIEKRDWVGE
jgi:hypothetical protein